MALEYHHPLSLTINRQVQYAVPRFVWAMQTVVYVYRFLDVNAGESRRRSYIRDRSNRSCDEILINAIIMHQNSRAYIPHMIRRIAVLAHQHNSTCNPPSRIIDKSSSHFTSSVPICNTSNWRIMLRLPSMYTTYNTMYPNRMASGIRQRNNTINTIRHLPYMYSVSIYS